MMSSVLAVSALLLVAFEASPIPGGTSLVGLGQNSSLPFSLGAALPNTLITKFITDLLPDVSASIDPNLAIEGIAGPLDGGTALGLPLSGSLAGLGGTVSGSPYDGHWIKLGGGPSKK